MSKQSKKKQPLIRWLPNMKRVLYALIPAMLASIYFFGWKALVLLAVVNVVGFLTEYIFVRVLYKEPVNSSVFVTNCLFALTLPPTIPIWMAIVGIIFGVLFGKMVFGGFGRNVFNPAIVGRAFIYISFGVEMTASWVEPVKGLVGGFSVWVSDAMTQATPIQMLSAGSEDAPSYLEMLLGNISGSLGETSALLILIGGIYLVFTKTANYKLVLSTFIGFIAMQGILWLTGIEPAFDPLAGMLTGGFMLGAFFMVTDPISAAGTDLGKWINGAFVGVLTVLIRSFSIWAEGMMFAILLANMFTPVLDYAIKQVKAKQKEKKEATA